MARFKENELAKLQIAEREQRRKEIDKGLKEVNFVLIGLCKTLVGRSDLCDDMRPPASFVVIIHPSQSEVLECFENSLTSKFYMTTIPTYSAAEPDMTSLSTSGSKLSGKTSKMLPTTALGGISQEWFKLSSRNFTRLLGTIVSTNSPNMTSLDLLVGYKIQLNTTQKCVKQVRPAKESNVSNALSFVKLWCHYLCAIYCI